MKLELRLYVSMTEKEVKTIEDARKILYRTSNRGPWFGNNPQHLCFSNRSKFGYWDLQHGRNAFDFELVHWSRVSENRKLSYLRTRSNEPKVSEVVKKLRSALKVIDRALKLCDESKSHD